MDPQVEVCLLSALVHTRKILVRSFSCDSEKSARRCNDLEWFRFLVWTNTEVQVVSDQEKQQGHPANLELWHHNAQVASKIKAANLHKNTTKSWNCCVFSSIYLLVRLLKYLSSAPMNQIKIATILLLLGQSNTQRCDTKPSPCKQLTKTSRFKHGLPFLVKS